MLERAWFRYADVVKCGEESRVFSCCSDVRVAVGLVVGLVVGGLMEGGSRGGGGKIVVIVVFF